MVSADRTVRLPLNISESRKTSTGRFLTTYSGAGVQHIALTSNDIVATLRSLAARGTRTLPIPPNYCCRRSPSRR
jgi:3-dehydroshikimate dehydratase